ncbi:unnamed protein product [Penicillium glandicola]
MSIILHWEATFNQGANIPTVEGYPNLHLELVTTTWLPRWRPVSDKGGSSSTTIPKEKRRIPPSRANPTDCTRSHHLGQPNTHKMSEPGPESIPTSADPRSKRPTKRRAVTPHSEVANQIETLFKDPSKDLQLPDVLKPRTVASLSAPPEIVTNVQGSSAGAGSGEFHVYKASRRREYERLRLMQSEVDNEKSNETWEKERAEAKRKDDEKTEKNRRRREKKKNARGKKGGQNDMAPVNGPAVPGSMVTMEDRDGGAVDGEVAQQEVPGVIFHED